MLPDDILPMIIHTDRAVMLRLASTCKQIRKEVVGSDEFHTACAEERARVVAKIVTAMETIWPGSARVDYIAFRYSVLPWSETRFEVFIHSRAWHLSNPRLSKKLLLGRGLCGTFRNSDALLDFMKIFANINGELQSAIGELFAALGVDPLNICDIEHITRHVKEHGVAFRGRRYRLDDGTWFQREM